MKALVAEAGDGWLPWLETPETYRRASDQITSETQKHGRNPDEIDRAVEVFTAITRDETESITRIAQRASIGMSLRQDLLRQLGYRVSRTSRSTCTKAEFREEDWRKINSVAGRIPREAIRSVMVSGTPDQAIDRLEEYQEGWCEERRPDLAHRPDLPEHSGIPGRDHSRTSRPRTASST